MKKILSAIATASLILAAGCTKEQTRPVGVEREVSLMVGEVQTKTVTDISDNSTVFAAGDVIGVFSSGLESDMADVAFTVPSSTSDPLTHEGTYNYKEDGTAATFHAYYPKGDAAVVSGTAVAFTVSAQNTAELFNANDFLTTADGGITGDPATNDGKVTLNFQHRLSLVKVVWNVDGLTASAVSVNNVLPTVTWDYSAKTLAASGNAADIKMWQTETDGTEFWALIPAQEFASGKALFTVTASDGKTYQFTPSSAITFSSGKTKKFTLTKSSGSSTVLTAVVANAGSIGAWDAEDESVDLGGDVETVLSTLMSADAGDFAKVTLGTTSTSLSADHEEGWHQLGANVTVAIKQEESSLTLTNTAASSSWYNRAVIYRGKTVPKTDCTYILSFEAKSTESKDLQVAVMQPLATANTWFAIGGTTAAKYQTLTNEYAAISVEVDFANANIEGATVENGFIVLFTQKESTSTTDVLSIRNVTFTEKAE